MYSGFIRASLQQIAAAYNEVKGSHAAETVIIKLWALKPKQISALQS